MSYKRKRERGYDICEYCGAHLDPGERCDCQRENGCNRSFFPNNESERATISLQLD